MQRCVSETTGPVHYFDTIFALQLYREARIMYKEFSSGGGMYMFPCICCRKLCEKAVPGNKVCVTGIYAIKRAVSSKKDRNAPKVNAGKFPPV